MYGQPPRFTRRPAGGRGPASPPQHNPLYPQSPNYYLPNPNLAPPLNQFIQTPNFHFQNPNFSIPTPSFPVRSPNPRPRSNEALDRIDRAALKARAELLAAGESVTAWKVSQAALLTLKAESWESLGFQMQQVPSLYRLMVIEGKVNAFIHCFVGVQKITSLYDLELAICKNEGTEKFDELDLGPLVRHPLVVHYFGVSSEVKDVFKITSVEIITFLSAFMRKKHKDIKADELLDFIAKKKSVEREELLGVRIQSLGMHMSHIKQGWNFEQASIKKYIGDAKPTSGNKRRKRPLFTSQKKQLDEHFGRISERVNSFTSAHEDFCGKHIKFNSSSSEDVSDSSSDGEGNRDENLPQNSGRYQSQNENSSDRVSSCPYPSIIEERTRLGLKSDVGPNPSTASSSLIDNELSKPLKRKRQSENLSTGTPAHELLKRDEVDAHRLINNKQFNMSKANKKKLKFLSQINDVELSRDNDSIRMFILTWKEACRENNVTEVLDRMIQFYKTRKGKKVKAMFMQKPCAELLNVAVEAIKTGMCDSVYDTLQTLNQLDVANPLPKKCIEAVSIEVEPSEKKIVAIGRDLAYQHSVTAEDIVKKLVTYFANDLETVGKGNPSFGAKIIFLRKLSKFEFWLAEQFSVENFMSLGYGDFFTFIEQHISLLPHAFQRCLSVEMCENISLGACMLQHQLDVLLYQASNSLLENEILSEQKISELLARQFPSICLKLVTDGSLKNIEELLKGKKQYESSNIVLFSATLFGKSSSEYISDHNGNPDGSDSCVGHNTGVLGTVSTKDALEALIRAPMLTDLDSWSHWGHKFYPSFGPLLPWLLTEVNSRELLCLVTKEGKVMRIDPSASLDSFLEAFLRGSSFETAVQLLSLVALYGGDCNVPLSLLKCHARKAFEVIIRNSLDDELDNNNGKLFNRGLVFVEAANNGENKNRCGFDRAMSIAAKFFLNCLGCLPVEIHKFAADLLLTGLQFVTKEAPLAILNECNNMKQRCMLHDAGLSLGIAEWINDYNAFCLTRSQELALSSTQTSLIDASFKCTDANTYTQKAGDSFPFTGDEVNVPLVTTQPNEQHKEVCTTKMNMETSINIAHESKHFSQGDEVNSPDTVVESIRREEFGLDPDLMASESSMLKKQHARLGRALHCLSQELYSQDSHFLLELVQNADDNVYPGNVEPTLTFILMEGCIVVLNNERGFSGDNIRALCDVGNSTKKEPSAGYIGKKGIGFKSVFRVSDAPEIHSNGFHIKFDISEGQIGFVLPTRIPPCDVESFSKLVKQDADENDNIWNTCIVLPFRSKFSEALPMDKIASMFSDLHPSLLLFLHRLQCIRFRNMLSDSLTVMRKEILGSGIIKVSLGNEKLTWFVVSDKLNSGAIRPDVKTTEISIAFTLHDLGNEEYIPRLDQQPVFAYLPLRTYGMKFIIQGDFILPSSREEVDGDSPWNQWLLSEFPRLFVSAEKSFCSLPCYRAKQGKAVSAFMSFVPLVGEVHGFFSSVPRMIISKLRRSNCLLLDGDIDEWVPPCKVIRNWTDQTRDLLPDSLLSQHLGLGLLHRDTILSDALAKALGIEEYGPRILLQVLSSLCNSGDGLRSMGFSWLTSWLNAIYLMSFHSGKVISHNTTELDILTKLRKIPFIPLSDGKYASLTDGTIWLHSDADSEYIPEAFPKLYANLRTVNPVLLPAVTNSKILQNDTYMVDNVTKMLCLAGVERLSAHEIVKVHILPALSSVKNGQDDNEMIEYLSFVMFHLQSKCSNCCSAEREQILSELCSKAYILTNYGYKRLADTAIHFSNDFANPIDMNKLINGIELKWHEIDNNYLKHPITKSVSDGILKWRNFFKDLGVTDFVQVVETKKCVSRISEVLNIMSDKDMISSNSIVDDWESNELIHLLSQLSSVGNRDKCSYLLEIFDTLWDEYFSNKVSGYCNTSSGEKIAFKSSLLSSLHDARWIATAVGEDLYYPKDVFHDCETVRSILGVNVPYAVPKVKSTKLLNDLGFKIHVTVDDILSILQVWRTSQIPFRASISQMSKLYTCVSNEIVASKSKVMSTLTSGAFIFVPYLAGSLSQDVVSGVLLSPEEVYWHDLTGSVDQIEGKCPSTDLVGKTHGPCSNMLKSIYPGLHDFFVNECGVQESPPFRNYLQILQQLSAVALPSQAAKIVFQVFSTCADGLKSGELSSKDIDYFKECLLHLDFTVLPTSVDRWISLHPSFGLVCWSDDEKLRKEFKHCDHIEFLYFGELSDDEKETLQKKMSVFMRQLGIHALSEVVTREAIYYGPAESGFKTLLINWALPFAQRYIYKSYPDRYNQLKQSGFVDICQLRIVVVEKLYYRNVIKRSDVSSKKRRECSCLLQGNLLYVAQDSDSHSIFLELSRQLVDGNPELHLANFLHMITTMAESGSTEEQTEFFILNSQKVPKLPVEESAWALPSALPSAENDDNTLSRSVTTVIDEPNSLSKRRYNVNSNWPPANWKTAPGFGSAYANGFMTKPSNTVQLRKENNDDDLSCPIDSATIIKANADRTVEDESVALLADINIDSEYLEIQADYASNMVLPGMNVDFDSVDVVATTEDPNTGSVIPYERDQLSIGNANVQQALLTGRLGELVAYRYFSGKFGATCVKWVNETHETGFPYDIVVGDEYVEVKATKSARKDWFNITAREWQFAAEKGECYSIARVTLRGNDMAKLTVYKNPARLCKLGQLQLAILIPRLQHNKDIASC
ncbi:Sacsin [Heracleum sosnowskyi]|uniref:Sacsin n=1 Tax=Heracleum sosnowskyi TaxID=360622 RepID=A0AAD8MU12_9APIA|nr:Sacsin [Heracleum sosnowskyi]